MRVADRYPPERLAAVGEEHLPNGAHRRTEVSYPDWVPDEVADAAARLTEADALEQLPPCLRGD